MPSSSVAQAYDVLSDYINASSKSLGAAQDTLCEPVEDAWMSTQNPSDVLEKLDSIWAGILSLAKSTSFKQPQQQQKLVDFVANLQKRPTLEKDGQICKVHDMTVWKDLPTFGWAIRDAWNHSPGPNADDDTRDKWLNLNAFVASLLAKDPTDPLELSLFGIWSLRQALEEQGTASEGLVGAAASWLVYAAPTLARYSTESKTFDGKVAKPGSKFDDEDWRGFTQGRWNAWQQELDTLQGNLHNSDIKELVSQALKAIGECN